MFPTLGDTNIPQPHYGNTYFAGTQQKGKDKPATMVSKFIKKIS
jgi:hypothetical protein